MRMYEASDHSLTTSKTVKEPIRVLQSILSFIPKGGKFFLRLKTEFRREVTLAFKVLLAPCGQLHGPAFWVAEQHKGVGW